MEYTDETPVIDLPFSYRARKNLMIWFYRGNRERGMVYGDLKKLSRHDLEGIKGIGKGTAGEIMKFISETRGEEMDYVKGMLDLMDVVEGINNELQELKDKLRWALR